MQMVYVNYNLCDAELTLEKGEQREETVQAEQRENKASGSLVSEQLTLSYTGWSRTHGTLILEPQSPKQGVLQALPPHLNKMADFNSFK